MTAIFNWAVNLLTAALVAVSVAYLVNGGLRGRGPRRIAAAVLGLAAGGVALWGVAAVEKLESTARGIVVSILLSGLLFIGANKLFDLAPTRWALFRALMGGGGALAVFLLLWGNRAIDQPALRTFIAVLVGAAGGYLLGVAEGRWRRLLIGAGAGAALGVLAATGMRTVILRFELEEGIFDLWPALPDLNFRALAIMTAVGAAGGYLLGVAEGKRRRFLIKAGTVAALGVLVATGMNFIALAAIAALGAAAGYLWRSRRKGKSPASVVVGWATIGFFIGAWGMPTLGTGQWWEALLAAVGTGLGAGAALGLRPIPDANQRSRLEASSRSYIFVIPALLFIGGTLIYPTLRTLFLSFYDMRGEEPVGFANYSSIFTSANSFDVSGWAGIFGSRLFWAGAVIAALGTVVAIIMGRRSGYKATFGPGAGGATVLGLFLVCMAAFAALRGTLFNNIWWVLTVTLVTTAAGLAIAVLADRAKNESLAKSLIFMPMAISFVGAGIIWRFMYLARDPSREQTGFLNALWVGLGRISSNPGARMVTVIIVLSLALLLIWLALRSWRAGERVIASGAALCALPFLWFAFAVWRGIGGVTEGPGGELLADTVLFVQETPFNNMWLMLVLIWIQTGFSMVIFSAAIKAVPAELIEAARVDGATESQTFWRVTVPQIAPTIGVVVTTLIVLVMKVFDIVKVMTNGNFDTQVIANEMWQRAFTELNFGLGSALAVVLFVAVLPILYLNIRRMQKAAG